MSVNLRPVGPARAWRGAILSRDAGTQSRTEDRLDEDSRMALENVQATPGKRTDVQIARIAARQHGNVTRPQLLAAGYNDRGIGARVAAGRLFREHAGVYSVGRPATVPLERAAAAVLACGAAAALSHSSAMTLWGFWRRWEAPLEITVSAGRPRPGRVRIHRSTTLTAEDIRTHLELTITSPARTLVDIAPRLDDHRLARTVDDALLTPFLTRSALVEQIERSPGRPGLRRIAAHINLTDQPSRSDWERAFPAFCRRYGLPIPLLNTVIAGREVDALFPEEDLIVELDGWRFHSGPRAFESDRERDADMLVIGHATVRITWKRLRDAPRREATRLREILETRRRASEAAVAGSVTRASARAAGSVSGPRGSTETPAAPGVRHQASDRRAR